MPRHVGFTPVPDDANLDEFFKQIAQDNHEEMISMLDQLRATIVQTQTDGEPSMFAYGKMINKLFTLEMPEMIRLLSATLWELA